MSILSYHLHYYDIVWISWHLKSPATPQLVQAKKEASLLCITLPSSYGNPPVTVDALTKGQQYSKRFHCLASSWNVFPATVCQWYHIETNPGPNSCIWSLRLLSTHALLVHPLERHLLVFLPWTNGTRVEIRMGETGWNLLPTRLYILNNTFCWNKPFALRLNFTMVS